MKKLLLFIAFLLPMVAFAQTRSIEYQHETECSTVLYCGVTLPSSDTFLGWTFDTNCLAFLGETSPSGYTRRAAFRIKSSGNHTTYIGARYATSQGREYIIYPEDDFSYNIEFAPQLLYRVIGPMGPYAEYSIQVLKPNDNYNFQAEGIIIEYFLPSNWHITSIGNGYCIFVKESSTPIDPPPSFVRASLDIAGCSSPTLGVEGTFPPNAPGYYSSSSPSNQSESQLLQSQASESIATQADAKATQALVYDVFGSLVYSSAIASDYFDIKSANIKNGAYIVKTQYSDGSEKSEKVLINK
jgi:hypothetical protein